MSEQHEARYDGNSPEDHLIRYKWVLPASGDGEHGSDAEKVYGDALMKLGGLLEAHGIDSPHERNVIMGNLVPGPFYGQEGSASFDEWLMQLRLIPLRLLDKELPPIETYTDQYLCEVFATALPEGTPHGAICANSENEGTACSLAAICPARTASDIGLRQLGLLIFDLHTYERSDGATDIKRVERSISDLTYRLKHHGLVDDRDLGIVVGEMNKVANDFFQAISRPQHRRTD